MRISRLAVTLLVVAVLAISTPAYADQKQSNLTLTFNGAILSSGTQSYSHDGGKLVLGTWLGNPIDPSKANLDYSLNAHITGLAAKGEADFTFTVKGADGSSTKVTGDAPISGMIPAEAFPLDCNLGVEPCTSGVPGVFTGQAAVTVQTCHSGNDQSSNQGPKSSDGHGSDHGDKGCSKASHLTLPMEFESAFLNPFGGPIFMLSQGGEIFVESTYAESRVTWTGIQLGGSATGTLAGSPVSGGFAMKVSAVEDLKAGTEVEHGTIALFGMNPPNLNAAGHFDGKSTIPQPGSPCPLPPPPFQPFPPGTCQLTGFQSSGDFSMDASSGGSIKGTYSTAWDVPAVTFTSSVSATFDSGHGHAGGDGK
jgi:hypothetical protein